MFRDGLVFMHAFYRAILLGLRPRNDGMVHQGAVPCHGVGELRGGERDIWRDDHNRR